MKAVVFSGTTEGRRFSKKLAELGVAVTVCVATPLGAEEQGEMAGITVHAGRLQPDAMAALLAGADLCVDATHPYAVDATRNIRAAAVQAGVEYRRLLRAQSPLPPGCAVFETAAQAAEYLAGTEGNILLATGAKELAVFAGLEPARLYPRVLPTPEGIAACEAANVPHRNIIAMQGPFSLALNKALITQFQIRYLVTKDGGAAGGFAEKVQAAADTGAQLVVLRRIVNILVLPEPLIWITTPRKLCTRSLLPSTILYDTVIVSPALNWGTSASPFVHNCSFTSLMIASLFIAATFV